MHPLKRIRKEKNVSQQQLADVLGVRATCISRYELGQRALSVEKAKQLAAYLDISWTMLYGEDCESGS